MNDTDFQIQKDRARVKIRAPMIGSGEFSLFLAGGSSRHRGRQALSDALNGTDRFVAARPVSDDGDDDVVMIQISKIVWIEVLNPQHSESDWVQVREHATGVFGRMCFDEGSEITGAIVELTRRSARRLKDLLNVQERFVHVEDAKGKLFLVNLDRLVAAWPAKEIAPVVPVKTVDSDRA
jgi:hypothetical protein